MFLCRVLRLMGSQRNELLAVECWLFGSRMNEFLGTLNSSLFILFGVTKVDKKIGYCQVLLQVLKFKLADIS